MKYLIYFQKNITTLENNIKVIASNPIYPYITIGLFNGTLILISYYNIETPKILAKFNLNDKEINKIVYNEAGNLIAAAQMEEGIFFILRVYPGIIIIFFNQYMIYFYFQANPNENIEIISYIDYHQTAIDIAILENEKSYKLLILVHQSENNYNASNKIHMKMILKSDFKIKKKNYRSDRLITNLVVLNNTFIAKIYDEKNLFRFQFHVRRNLKLSLQFLLIAMFQKKMIKFTNEIICKNHLFYYVLNTNGRNLFTCSVNGLLAILNDDFSQLFATFLVHHRKDGGIINALVDPYLRFVITLGQENELVHTKITQTLFDEKKYKIAQNIFDEYKDCFFIHLPQKEPGIYSIQFFHSMPH